MQVDFFEPPGSPEDPVDVWFRQQSPPSPTDRDVAEILCGLYASTSGQPPAPDVQPFVESDPSTGPEPLREIPVRGPSYASVEAQLAPPAGGPSRPQATGAAKTTFAKTTSAKTTSAKTTSAKTTSAKTTSAKRPPAERPPAETYTVPKKCTFRDPLIPVDMLLKDVCQNLSNEDRETMRKTLSDAVKRAFEDALQRDLYDLEDGIVKRLVAAMVGLPIDEKDVWAKRKKDPVMKRLLILMVTIYRYGYENCCRQGVLREPLRDLAKKVSDARTANPALTAALEKWAWTDLVPWVCTYTFMKSDNNEAHENGENKKRRAKVAEALQAAFGRLGLDGAAEVLALNAFGMDDKHNDTKGSFWLLVVKAICTAYGIPYDEIPNDKTWNEMAAHGFLALVVPVVGAFAVSMYSDSDVPAPKQMGAMLPKSLISIYTHMSSVVSGYPPCDEFCAAIEKDPEAAFGLIVLGYIPYRVPRGMGGKEPPRKKPCV
jgi:hypothetical protein